jgi:mannose-6-phosphate isomerase
VFRLKNPVRDYAWGSYDDIPAFLGAPVPSPKPQAELWLGAHPSAPSLVELGGRLEPLDAAIARDPRRFLGSVAERGFDSLPFLFKLLSAASPLSLQAHPSKAQAKRGFDRENRAGIPLDARERCYRDATHKPELLVALTRFEAFAGFHDPRQTRETLAALATPELDRSIECLDSLPAEQALGTVLERWLTAPGPERAQLARASVLAAQRRLDQATLSDTERQALAWTVRLGEAYPGDIGCLVTLLLHYECLEPGEALFLPAGVLHEFCWRQVARLRLSICCCKAASGASIRDGGAYRRGIQSPSDLRRLSAQKAAQPDASQ